MAKKVITGFAARLRELRTGASLTQAELADKAGMHLHGLTKLEQGDREPAWATVQALAHALGVSCEAFQTAEPPAKREEEAASADPPPPRPRGRPKKGGASSSSAEAKPSAKRKRGK